jgi:cytochrome c
MDDRFNTIAGWTLFGGIVALGFASVSRHYFEADKAHRPHTMGYAIEGVSDAGEGGEAAVPLPNLLAAADPAKGQALFAKCQACHTIAQGGANGIGPNLWGMMGKPIGKHAPGSPTRPTLPAKAATGTSPTWTRGSRARRSSPAAPR